LWFVLRNYGVKGIQERLRFHISLAKKMTDWIDSSKDFELLTDTTLNLVCFRYNPEEATEEELNELNQQLMNQLNSEGKIYLTHTKIEGKFTLRVCIGQTYVEERHVIESWQEIKKMAEKTVFS
jgi:aromatic-L-amino-acid decarboxylase